MISTLMLYIAYTLSTVDSFVSICIFWKSNIWAITFSSGHCSVECFLNDSNNHGPCIFMVINYIWEPETLNTMHSHCCLLSQTVIHFFIECLPWQHVYFSVKGHEAVLICLVVTLMFSKWLHICCHGCSNSALYIYIYMT